MESRDDEQVMPVDEGCGEFKVLKMQKESPYLASWADHKRVASLAPGHCHPMML